MTLQTRANYTLSRHDQDLWERGDLSIDGIYKAWRERGDRRVAEYIIKLAQLDPQPKGYKKWMKEGKANYNQLVDELTPWRIRGTLRARAKALDPPIYFLSEMKRNDLRDLIAKIHAEQWERIQEHPDYLPERLKLDQVLLDLWQSKEIFAREVLIEVIRFVPFKYGPWRAIKHIFKQSIEVQDWSIFAMIAARIDIMTKQGSSGYRGTPQDGFRVSWQANQSDVTTRTLKYLTRRSWRTMRKLAVEQPSLYAEVAASILSHYSANLSTWVLANCWLYNHILFHETKRYSAESFYYYPSDYYKHRAYSDLWNLRIDPLLNLLKVAQQDGVLRFTCDSLTNDFKTELQQLDATWALSIARLNRSKLQDFLITWYKTICPTSQKDYQTQGLHKALLWLLYAGKDYAIQYFKVHPEALIELMDVQSAISLARNPHKELRALGQQILDPKTKHFTLSLDQWTILLCDEYSFDFASAHIKQIFSSDTLTFPWFAQCINTELDKASKFASDLLKDSHYRPTDGDLLAFYWALLENKTWRKRSSDVAFEGLESLISDEGTDRYLNQLTHDQLFTLLLHPESSARTALQKWIKKSYLNPKIFTVEWLKYLMQESTWEDQKWHGLLHTCADEWKYQRHFDRNVAKIAQEWLLNPRLFTVEDLGESWLLHMAFEQSSWAYEVYRDYVATHAPFSTFLHLPHVTDELKNKHSGKKSAQKAGLQVLLNYLLHPSCSYTSQRLIREILTKRHENYQLARNPNAKKLKKAMSLSGKLLSFSVFDTLAWSVNESDRRLAIQFATYELQRWTEDEPLSFTHLEPFFTHGFAEIQQFLLQAMSTKPISAEARIDVRLPQFKANDLYRFCFSPRAQVRDLGLTLIGDYPQLFADPTQLALLAESSDRRVCEGVVGLLWNRLRHKEVSQPWKPFIQSVYPQSAVAKNRVEVRAAYAHTATRKEKNVHYIGGGVDARTLFESDGQAWLIDFLRRTVFRLSAVHPLKEDLKRLSTVTSTWRNKVNLIKALRDLAVQDQRFAQLVTPILEELLQSRTQSEKAACLVALTRIRAAHNMAV